MAVLIYLTHFTLSPKGFNPPFELWRVTSCWPKKSPRRPSPANPTAARFPSAQSQGRTDCRTRHIPMPPAAAPSSLMALLTLFPSLGGLEGEPIPCPTVTKGAFASQLVATRCSEWWVSQLYARIRCFPRRNLTIKLTGGQKRSFLTSRERSER